MSLVFQYFQPPVAGSINWARSLFARIRKTMRCFKTRASDMMKHAAAEEVCWLLPWVSCLEVHNEDSVAQKCVINCIRNKYMLYLKLKLEFC